MRALCALAMVVGVTAIASAAGPRIAGLLSPLPVFATVLLVFTHRHSGGAAARDVARGIATGASSYTAFFLLVGLALTAWGVLATYLTAAALAIACNAMTLGLVRPVAATQG